MKKTVTTLFVTTLTALGFAQDQTAFTNTFATSSSHVPVSAQESNKTGTIYIKMGANETDLFPNNVDLLMPELGLGYRQSNGHHGVDVSAEGGLRQVRTKAELKEGNYFYTLPKVNYLFYATPESNTSFYAGTGLAFGGQVQTRVETVETAAVEATVDAPAVAATSLTTETNQEFVGFIPNVVIGTEFGRKNAVKTFVQLEVSQPALEVYRTGEFPGPRASLFVGAGF